MSADERLVYENAASVVARSNFDRVAFDSVPTPYVDIGWLPKSRGMRRTEAPLAFHRHCAAPTPWLEMLEREVLSVERNI